MMTFEEVFAEMDRRGSIIERLEKRLDIALDALRNIDAVGVDFGYYEDAAMTMKEHCSKAMIDSALSKAPTKDKAE